MSITSFGDGFGADGTEERFDLMQLSVRVTDKPSSHLLDEDDLDDSALVP